MTHELPRGPLRWMADNSVAANLLMAVLLVGGLLFALRIRQEIFPTFDLDTITIEVVYPQASPEEVERGIIEAIEERVRGLEDVKEVRSVAREGSATVTVEMMEGGSLQKLNDEIKSEVARITTFPEDAEEPRIRISRRERQVLSLLFYGPTDRHTLKHVAEQVRDGLMMRGDVTRIDVSSVAPLEVGVEVPLVQLRRYGLTLDDVARRIRAFALETPGGTLKTPHGDILLRVTERKYYADEFAAIPLITAGDGTQVLLGDIARLEDTFEDINRYATFNGQPMVALEVYQVGDQTPIGVSRAVRAYLADYAHEIPAGISWKVWHDRSENFRQRVNLLQRNAFLGLIIVFLSLSLFLEARLAFWVMLGIPISFLGAFIFLPMMGVSINMITTFAFIIALGIVVDDAIVVGESIYEYHRQGYAMRDAAIMGVYDVATPVTFSILTNVATFLPLYFIPGMMGKIFRFIPLVVGTVFIISLIESLCILPAHLGHQKVRMKKRGIRGFLQRMQHAFSAWFMQMVRRYYASFLRFALRYRYITLSLGIALLIGVIGYVRSGRMGMALFPRAEADMAYASVTLPFDAPLSHVEAARDMLVAAAERVISENGGDTLSEGIRADINRHRVEVSVMLTPPDIRPLPTREFTMLWRRYTGQIPGAESVSFLFDRGGPGSGAALTVELTHRDHRQLEEAAAALGVALSYYTQVSDIDVGYSAGKAQFDVTMRPAGAVIGMTAQEVARQLRHAFFGAEALRQQRGRDEVKVMVRLPEEERESTYYLETYMLRLPNGEETPLRSVVEMKEGVSYTELNRRDGRRVLTVSADVTPHYQAGQIQAAIERDVFPSLMEQFPGLRFSYEGRQADMRESLRSLLIGFIMALFCVYALLAIPLKSYVLPIIIMISIPFGLVGAVLGHVIMGYSLSIMSLMGVVALSGVVVNDTLVLMDVTRKNRLENIPPRDAVVYAATRRFRPILLTTLTTFGGLAPMILETSRQARFLIPMAISLGFGVVFATVITLCLVPCFYMALEDVRTFLRTS